MDVNAFLPKKLGQVLNSLEPVDIQKFPHSFIHFIETNQTDLLDQFLSLFKNNTFELNAESSTYLKIFAQGDQEKQGSLYRNIMNGMHNRKNEREALRKKVQILNSKIRKKKAGPKTRIMRKNYGN